MKGTTIYIDKHSQYFYTYTNTKNSIVHQFILQHDTYGSVDHINRLKWHNRHMNLRLTNDTEHTKQITSARGANVPFD